MKKSITKTQKMVLGGIAILTLVVLATGQIHSNKTRGVNSWGSNSIEVAGVNSWGSYIIETRGVNSWGNS